MPVSSAICDIVTDVSPCSATSAAVVSRIAPRTARRCASIVSFHSLGITPLYVTAVSRHLDLTSTYCLVNCCHESLDNHARGEETHLADRPPYPGTPRWVKVFGIVVIVVILLVVVMMFISGGEHGPG